MISDYNYLLWLLEERRLYVGSGGGSGRSLMRRREEQLTATAKIYSAVDVETRDQDSVKLAFKVCRQNNVKHTQVYH